MQKSSNESYIQNGYQEAIRKLLLHNSVKLQGKNGLEWSGKFLQKGNLQSLDEYCDNAKRPDVKLGHYMNTKIGCPNPSLAIIWALESIALTEN